ncbi:MAG TPA: DNA-3-methyladenine glycosylase 2 family protein [Sphaerochaeta sp.]|nr:DNA-3-methyladenine glycosylase 2 family protein [Sphaerochaeta sp.]
MSILVTPSSEAIAHLTKSEPLLGAAITTIGPIARKGEADIFTSLVRQIIGQQISTAAQRTVFQRLVDHVGTLSAEAIGSCAIAELQQLGMSYRKAEYIHDLSTQIVSGSYSLEPLYTLSDEEAIDHLCTIRGVGRWTAEMLLIFTLERADVVSFLDLGIRRGMQRLYGLAEINRETFASYRTRYSPHGTAASLYLWEIAR